ncbi:Pyridox-oxidase domain containing protein [Pyrenophora tritici-repentis]|nr:Pyridox oxidase domain containing protein [Pyrenophora tritici-repentis]KAI1548897.1 Pyridox-oxidase domain containing protein [Pyrenophora tritici-repentis]
MAFSMGMPFNEGEEKMHRLLRVPPQDNPTSTMLTPQASNMFQRAPLLAFGTLDAQDRPWTTLWGGEPGFLEPLGGGFVGTRTLVDSKNDPVVQALVGDAKDGQTSKPADGGKPVAGLAIDLMTRKRVKTAGRMIAGALRDTDATTSPAQLLQLVTKIEQSLGNCPKYLNQYEIHPASISSTLQSCGPSLTPQATSLLWRADMFFLCTSTANDMDVNHRGGAPGFIRLISDTEIIYPEYSGNRLYQSLGNLQMRPQIGLTVPDYETGDILYITGVSEILSGGAAAILLPGSNLAVKITISEARFVQSGLPFRGTKKTPSPYNPPIRTLAAEGNIKSAISSSTIPITAHLTKLTPLTPSITRFKFSVPSGLSYEPSQWVALDFSNELDIGYEHMRDDDPLSLNDDFVRTFTISSAPSRETSSTGVEGKEKEFEITIRKVGAVTRFLCKQNERSGLEVLVRGVGGGMQIGTDSSAVIVASGVVDGVKEQLGKEARVVERRLRKDDVEGVEAETWYLCAGKGMRKEVLRWLDGKKVVTENFDY